MMTYFDRINYISGQCAIHNVPTLSTNVGKGGKSGSPGVKATWPPMTAHMARSPTWWKASSSPGMTVTLLS